METLRKMVIEMIVNNQSGAIEVGYAPVSGGTQSVSGGGLREFVETFLPDVSCSNFNFNKQIDILWDEGKGIVHPMTERGWEKPEQLHEQFGEYHKNPRGHYFFSVSGQDSAHSLANFHGVLDVAHDQEYIRRNQRLSSQSALEAGYGKSHMGGWVEI